MRLTVIIANTFEAEEAMIHLQQHRPFIRRTVHIDLTPEQMDQLKFREVGDTWDYKLKKRVPRYEEIHQVFLEQEPSHGQIEDRVD